MNNKEDTDISQCSSTQILEELNKRIKDKRIKVGTYGVILGIETAVQIILESNGHAVKIITV